MLDSSGAEYRESAFAFGEASESVRVGFDPVELRRLLRTSPEAWIEFHLKEQLTWAVPQFHIDSFELLINNEILRVALALPRGHAKTTLAKLAAIYYYCFFDDIRFILYISNTFTVAQEACNDIMTFMESPDFQDVFGPVEMITNRAGKGYWRFKFMDKVCILRALGAGQQVRGMNINNQRPQIGIIDDLEDDPDMDPDLRKKLKRWVYGSFMKAFDLRWNKLIWLGNFIAQDCILKDLCENPYWYSRRMGSLLGDGTPLWPELWPIQKLAEDYHSYKIAGSLAQWFAEMQNLPMPGSDGIIDSEAIAYRPPCLPEEVEMAFITIDPAYSKKKWANKSAVVVHGYFDDAWQVVDYISGKFTPDQLFYAAHAKAVEWKTTLIGVESGASQSSLQFLFKHLAMLAGRMDYIFVEIMAQNQRKVERLVGFCSMIRKKEYYLNDGDVHLVSQLISFDPKKEHNEDDLADAAAMGKYMIETYGMHVYEQRQVRLKLVPAPAMSGYEVCSV